MIYQTNNGESITLAAAVTLAVECNTTLTLTTAEQKALEYYLTNKLNNALNLFLIMSKTDRLVAGKHARDELIALEMVDPHDNTL